MPTRLPPAFIPLTTPQLRTLFMAGVDLTTVKELLGHKSLTMTLRYAHLAPAHKSKAVEILDSRLNDKIHFTITSQTGLQDIKKALNDEVKCPDLLDGPPGASCTAPRINSP